MARTPLSFTLHNTAVADIAGHFALLGHTNIRADHIAHANGAPVQIGNHIPDVTAYDFSTGRFIICEVETNDTINTQHTFEQLRTFRMAANLYGGFLHVGLPYLADIARARLVMTTWGITVDQWWYNKA